MSPELRLTALPGFPMVRPGDDLFAQIRQSLEEAGLALADGDLLVIAQKVVSKAEGRYADLKAVVAGERAQALAEEVDKDPRLVELILQESREVVRTRPGVIIVEHRNGYDMRQEPRSIHSEM